MTSKKSRGGVRKGDPKRRKKKIREVDIAPPSASPMTKSGGFFSTGMFYPPESQSARRDLLDSGHSSVDSTSSSVVPEEMETSSEDHREGYVSFHLKLQIDLVTCQRR